MKKLCISMLVLTAFTLCSVSELTLYSWYGYEEAAYKEAKLHTEKTHKNLMKVYEKMSKKQRGVRKTVPPGFYAEYGRELFKLGKKEEALKAFEKELELYPESKTLVSRLIQQIQNQ